VLERYVEARRTEPGGKFKRPASPNTLVNWRLMLSRYILPAVGDLHPDTITSEDFLAVLEDAVSRGGPSQGPRVREFIAAAWRWMEERPRTLGVSLPSASPLRDLPRVGKAERERERHLSPVEVWRFWRAADTEGLPGEALRFSLLTACRVREATCLPWSELDLDAALWRLPAPRSKGGKAREIPLSTQARELLRRVQGQSGDDYPFGEHCHYRTYHAMPRLRAATAGEPWQPRDLRRTAATLCARLGSDPFVVALCLGHARPDQRMPAVTGAYLRWNYADKVREALDRLGDWIEDTVSRSSEPGDVVSLEARR
jgi:integrase